MKTKGFLFFTRILLFVLLSAAAVLGQIEQIPIYKNKQMPIEARVQDLLNRMTLEEKVNLLSGHSPRTLGNPRLCIPELIKSDGPLGPNCRGRANNYSAMINLAATFDTDLMQKVAENIGEEVRILGRNWLLGPCVNIARVPNGGRTFEGFGEDPYLASRMTVAYVKGVQSKRVVACVKHFVANNQELGRGHVDARVSERALREIYLPAFKAAVRDAGCLSVMGAYNRVNGEYACENQHLLTEVLKKEWGFKGFVVTDWGAAHSTVKMANAGLDLEMPFPKFYGKNLLKAVRNGDVSEATLNDKVRRILRAMFWASLFDESADAYGGLDDTPDRRALALRAARESIVLLKNAHHFLPFHQNQFKSIAVIGPNGDVAQMAGGGSGYLKGIYGVSPLKGIRKKVGHSIQVSFARGIRPVSTELPILSARYYRLPDGRPGVYAEYFNNKELRGKPALTRIEKAIDFNWGFGGARQPGSPGSPAPGIIQLDHWSARWTGQLRSPGQGWYYIGLKADNGVRLYLDGKKVLDAWSNQDAGKFKIAKYKFQKGRWYRLRVEFYENIGSARCKLGVKPYPEKDFFQEAIQLAKRSDAVVLCMGLNPTLEGEGHDRDSLALPAIQEKLIRRISEVNKNSVVVLFSGTPILMNRWMASVPAIVEAFYPGEEGGNALADILFGDVNPSGRLPVTFPRRWQDTPVHDTYPNPDVAVYKEGIFVGYRYYDQYGIEPLFPFGYGLSYTKFVYSRLDIRPRNMTTGDTVEVSFEVKNSGKMAGEDVVQLYLHDVKSSLPREVKALKGFARVQLKPGEKKIIRLPLVRSQLTFYNPTLKKWMAEPGKFEVWIGRSSRDIRLKGSFFYEGEK